MSDQNAPALPSWMNDIIFTDDIETSFVRMLGYGPMGSGKTKFALSAPSPFVIDLDHGLLTGRKLRVPYKSIHAPKDRRDRAAVYQTVIDILADAKDKTNGFAPGQPLGSIQTIVLDGYTALADALMKEILYRDGLDPLKDKPEYSHWNALGVRLQTITALSEQLPYNFIATCGNKAEKDQVTDTWIGLPDIIGSFRHDIGYRFDEVYYFEPRRGRMADGDGAKGSLIYEMHTAKYKIYDAKSRLDLPPTVVDPTFDGVFSKEAMA